MHFVTLLSHGKCLNSKTMGRLARPPLAYWRATSMSHGLADSVTVSDLYKLRVSRSETRYDESQYRVVKHLDKLQTVIESLSAGAGLDRKQPRGVYLCGSVGIGKTMMMDLFFEGCRVDKKRRVHFHHFMLEIHKRVHEHKKALIDKFGRDRHINLSSERDAIAFVAAQVSAESRLLCFDEFHVTDIADAMIMTKLFGELWRHGTVLVATSNRHPDDLYENGLNRSYFLPFIDLLKNQCTTIALSTSKDYRLEAVKADGAYFLPLNESSKKKLHDACLLSASAVGSAKLELVNVPVMMGRQVQVQAAGRSCLVTFASLCEGDRGPADYHAICSQFDRVYLDGVRQLSLKVDCQCS